MVPPELTQFRSKEYEEMRTNEIYQSIQMTQPGLGLREFLDAHPIFRVNVRYLRYVQLTSGESKKKELKGESTCDMLT